MIFENKNKILQLIEKYNVNVLQLFMLDLAMDKDYASLHKYIDVHKHIDFNDLQDLVRKGLIENTLDVSSASTVDFLDIKVTYEFAENFIYDNGKAFHDLVHLYPSFGLIDGKSSMLKATGQHNGQHIDLDMLQDKYEKYISGDKTKHDLVMEKTTLLKKIGVLNFTFRKYVWDRCWEAFDIEELKDKAIESEISGFSNMQTI